MPDTAPLVVAVAYRDMNLFELGVASEVFGVQRPDFTQPLYRLKVAGAEPGDLQAPGGLRLKVDGGLRLLCSADIVLVPGWRDPADEPPVALLNALRQAHARGAMIVSFCAGAFVLAAAGLLDGKRATTHWRYAERFRQRFPAVELDPDVLYVNCGDVFTSAGGAAAIDLGLHIVRQHYGAAAANVMARALVSPPHREGGQAQFIDSPIPRREGRSLARLMEWARRHIDEPLTVTMLARRGAMSERTLLRRFFAEAGMTPAQWLTRERVALAQRLLETSRRSLPDVAEASGFGSTETFRAAFRRTLGVPPSTYRLRFQGTKGPFTAHLPKSRR